MAGKRETVFADEDAEAGTASTIPSQILGKATIRWLSCSPGKANPTPMTDIEIYREKLLALRDEILQLTDTRTASVATVTLDQSSVGRLSRMDALQQQAMAQNTSQRVERELRLIEAALRRCDEGVYGICTECDDPINPKRLAINPTITLCIECASTGER